MCPKQLNFWSVLRGICISSTFVAYPLLPKSDSFALHLSRYLGTAESQLTAGCRPLLLEFNFFKRNKVTKMYTFYETQAFISVCDIFIRSAAAVRLAGQNATTVSKQGVGFEITAGT
jgi:hypothetical protein